jgi:hypothetical protein
MGFSSSRFTEKHLLVVHKHNLGIAKAEINWKPIIGYFLSIALEEGNSHRRFGVALPHTDYEYVIRTGIAVGFLAQPVEFFMMGPASAGPGSHGLSHGHPGTQETDHLAGRTGKK